MRVLVAPDKFAGTLTARQAAEAIAAGWRRTSPGDQLTLLPMSDGGPGFVEVTGEHPDGHTIHLEAAQFAGLDRGLDPWNASTFELGLAVREAATERRRVCVGLGGTRTMDGGAGFLAALGATADVPLDAGPAGLRGITDVDLMPAKAWLAAVDLVGAADVDIPLLGLFGATKTFGPQKGLEDDELLGVDKILDEFVVATLGSSPAQRRLADSPGAGAAGGLGFAFLALGGRIVRGVDLVADVVGLNAACASHDLVLTGEGTFDHTSRTGKVVYGVAQAAAAAARPCVVLAGQVTVGSREARAMGIDAAYAAADAVGLDASLAEPSDSLARLAERAARTWSSRS
ncbi:MAG TPA: glycerate kinase [Aeromicrobium sp.]|nr:glycerate kinase [Aeromicrobium sp.]